MEMMAGPDVPARSSRPPAASANACSTSAPASAPPAMITTARRERREGSGVTPAIVGIGLHYPAHLEGLLEDGAPLRDDLGAERVIPCREALTGSAHQVKGRDPRPTTDTRRPPRCRSI